MIDSSKQKLSNRITAAAQLTLADIVVKNGRIVDVFNQEIMYGDVAITDGMIVGIGEFEGKTIIDANNRFICPGFIDGHVHIESSMLTPAEFAKVVLPHGVTTVIADPHEIANVNGTVGIEYMLAASEGIPLDVLVMLPSCVPATPFENAGAELNAEDLAPLYAHNRVVGLGEVMNAPAVLHAESSMLDKLVSAQEHGKLIDGHAAGLDEPAINAYMTAGIRTDHECTTAEEARDRLRRGMYVMIREGSAAKNLIELVKAVTPANSRRCLFVTDDRHLDDLIDEGSIDHSVRLSIQEGIDPITAIQMATLNAAECFGLKHKGAIAPGYDADFLLLDDLETVSISEVYKAGGQVAAKGSCVHSFPVSTKVPESVLNSMHAAPLSDGDLAIGMSQSHAKARVIGIQPNSIVTQHLVEEVETDELHYFQPSVEKDHLKMVVVERHQYTGNVGLGILKGLGIHSGAIAATVAHDSHNIVGAGTNDRDLLIAIDKIVELKGGLVVVRDGGVLASLSLPVAGLISDLDHQTVYDQLKLVNKALQDLGFEGNFNPFLTLSFMALPVIPALKLTDKGLFDFQTFTHVEIE